MSLSLSLVLSMGAPAPYTPEATAYFAAMSVQPDATRKGQLNTLIAALKAGGVWSKLDWLTIHAAHDEQAARVNMVAPGEVAAVGVAPTFTTDRGHTGNGTTQYLSTGWNPTVGTHQFVQDNAHLGVWNGLDIAGGFDLGATNARLGASTTTLSWRANQASNATSATTAGGIGHSMWCRTGASAADLYRNAVAVGSTAIASAAPANAELLLLANNSSTTGTITPASFCTRRIQAAHWGSQLTAGEVTALYNALATYMTAVGA